MVLSAMMLDAQQREDMNLKGEKARLRQGVASGEVTRGEARKARKEMNDVRVAKQNAKADGVVTVDERKEIAKQDRQADRNDSSCQAQRKTKKIINCFDFSIESRALLGTLFFCQDSNKEAITIIIHWL